MHSSESLSIDTSDPQLVRVHYERVRTPGHTRRNVLVLERAHVGFVLRWLEDAAAAPDVPRSEARLGRATIYLYESGDRGELYYNLQCERDADAPAPGISGMALRAEGLRQLIELLRAV